MVQRIKRRPRTRALWALLCPWFPGVTVAESLQGLIFFFCRYLPELVEKKKKTNRILGCGVFICTQTLL